MNPAYLGIGAAVLYIAGTAIQLSTIQRTFSGATSDGVSGGVSGGTGTKPTNGGQPGRRAGFFLLTSIAIALHGTVCYLVMAQPTGVDLGLFAVASLTFFILTSLLFASSLRVPVGNLFVAVLPLGAASVLASAWNPGTPIAYAQFSAGLLGHVLLSIVAYIVLLGAAFQSAALSIQERALKAKRSMVWLNLLPPLQSMEALLFQLLWVGYVLLTLAIGSGLLYLDDMFAQRVAHHTAFAVASWVCFSVLLLGRSAFGWRGTTAIRWTLVGFMLLAIGYFGSKFVLEILLGGN